MAGRDQQLGTGPVLPRHDAIYSPAACHTAHSALQRSSNLMAEPEPEPVPQAAAAGRPPLVCAPCWICLEDGPDEAGEPLIRECACRGETSAGYHFSCIVQYATAKLDQLLSDESNKDMAFSMMDICRSNFETDWKQCPNCCQPYNKTICKPIAQALVQFSDDRNLPKRLISFGSRHASFVPTLFFIPSKPKKRSTMQ